MENYHGLFNQKLDEYFYGHVFGGFNWWFLVIVSILSWVLWWRMVDHKRIIELVMYGSFVLIVTTVLDGIGIEKRIWTYPTMVLPFYARFIPVDFAIMPVVYMLIYQYTNNWKSFCWATVIQSAVFCWVAEPFLTWMGIYKMISWKYAYSFPVYIGIGLFLRWFVKAIWKKYTPSSTEVGGES